MATKTTDKRTVSIAVTRAELAGLLGSQAKQMGLIDFDPDAVEVLDQGDADGFEIILTVATAPAAPGG